MAEEHRAKQNQIYLDWNATTSVRVEVLAAMLPWFRDQYGNPSSTVHTLGRTARHAVAAARHEVAKLVSCDPTEVFFTSGASEANATAILGARIAHQPPTSIVTSDIEHQSVNAACAIAASRNARLQVLKVGRSGAVSPELLDSAPIGPTTLVTVQWVNNETGAINPIAEIADRVKSRGAVLHVDAAQAPGKVDIGIRELPIDLLTLSAHKMSGPKGIGALIVRNGVQLEPLVPGTQESHQRGGTENVPGIVGMGAACAAILQKGLAERQYVSGLRDRLEVGVLAGCGGTAIIRPAGSRIGNTTMFAWEGLDSTDVLRELDLSGVFAGRGSACASDVAGPSHVLRAMGVPPDLGVSAIRCSLGHSNTTSEIDSAIDAIVRAVKHIRSAGTRKR